MIEGFFFRVSNYIVIFIIFGGQKVNKGKVLLNIKLFIVLALILYVKDFSIAQTNNLINIILIGVSISLGLGVTFIKAYLPMYFRPSVIIVALFLVQISLYTQGIIETGYILYLVPITLAVLAYGVIGGIVSFFTICVMFYNFVLIEKIEMAFYLQQVLFLSIANLGFCFFAQQSKDIGIKNEKWLKKLHVKINELSLLKEIGNTMQTATSLKKVNRIILTAVTSGYGLGFNRALLFLTEQKNSSLILKGEMAIGPLTLQEAYRIWGSVVRNQKSLKKVIAVQDEVDETLNEYIRRVEIGSEEGSENPLFKTLETREPIIMQSADPLILGRDLASLSFENYAIVPLVAKNMAIGVLLVDNKFNGKPISEEDLDSLITFATQAALALENIMLYEKITRLAVTDGLTDLYNHRYFKEQLNLYIKNQNKFCLLVIDIDDFKEFNELYGHACGDSVLKAVAKGLKRAINDKGIISRYGGDEFTIILPNTSRKEAKEIAYSIQDQVKEISKGFDGVVKKHLTLSIGLAMYPNDALTADDLFRKADTKLKLSKVSGKDTVT